MNYFLIAIVTFLTPIMVLAADEPKAPATVKELWADFDPRKDSLDAKIVREWEKDSIVYRYVTFHIGNFKGKSARMAGFFGFAKGAKKLPGLLHQHGGGQRAFLHEVEFHAKRGYACLSINWGGREMEKAQQKPTTAIEDAISTEDQLRPIPGGPSRERVRRIPTNRRIFREV